ncbi:3-phosphoshikimate 1-carboxyvinyltransferase [Nesterenkonia ebinurensis]|uniref:3-phosphoshikimate 1-carboxyvinyltransferase n=1 Tax=Nesterenkonia ebinurensis TaxID=2608252 RepID=UPI001CC6260A|nr:3-phosphoshikimate 1-carboxyvinyltransferase [Nesterenkonia ebinurensis]
MTAVAPGGGWNAPHPGSSVRGEVRVPASKSLTNRYLLLAALAEGPSVVVNPLVSRDSRLMLTALEALGAQVERITDWGDSGEAAVRITPIPLSAPGTGADPVSIDCGLAGTVMRFLPAVAALTARTVHFDGDPEAKLRPMTAVLEGLRALGVQIGDDGAPGFLPFTVHSSTGHSPAEITGGDVTIDASATSQFVSGLLLAAPRMPEGLTLRHSGAQVPSLEHVEMTLSVLDGLGVQVSSPAQYTWRVEPGPIAPFTARVEPDLSNAGPFLCAAAVTGGEVTMPGWPLGSTQIGRRWTQLLADFGCQVELSPVSESTATLSVRGPSRLVSPGVVDGTAELTPTVAALAALCAEESKFTSVGHLRGHETDRIAALVTEIRRLGGKAEETDDGFRILSPITRGAVVRSYADHRMATFGAVLGLAVEGVTVEDIGCTAKTMPDFPHRWASLVSQ